jgi:hypothetical protein
MSLPGMGGTEPEWTAAVKKYNATLKKHNKPSSGFAMGPPDVKAALGHGKSFIMCASDFFPLVGEAASIAQTRTEFPAQDFSKVYKDW